MNALGFMAGQRRVTEILTSGAPSELISIASHPDHDTLSGGHSYGFWLDGPCCPWVGGDGKTYVIFPAPENYRMEVGAGGWSNGANWSGATKVYSSPRNATESNYANQIWIFGTYASGNNVWAIGHMEWYVDMESDDGIAGYNANDAGHKHVTQPVWMKSTDNGATWAIKSTAADRPILKNEAWATQSRETLYGNRHSTNIVCPADVGQDDDHYYSMLDTLYLPGGTDLVDVGFVLVRTSDLDSSTTWEYWGGSGWTPVNRSIYQGNTSTQVPYLFFKASGVDPFTTTPRTNRLAQSIRWHERTKQWLVFGYRGDKAGIVCASRTKSLANPRFEANGNLFWTLGSGDAVGNYTSEAYIGVFDPDTATDQNFTTIGDNPICVVVDSRYRFMKNTLSLSVF